MKIQDAIKVFTAQDRQGRYLFNSRHMVKLFPQDSDRARRAGIQRLIQNEILIRATKGIYAYAHSRHLSADTIEEIAKMMRIGEYSYVSLESALSEYGLISQVPIDRLTVMTTGRAGEIKTPFGVIEFTHTDRSVVDVYESFISIGRPLRFAKKQAAIRDLRRVGRNTHLLDER